MNLKAQARKKHGILWPWSREEILAITGLFRILTRLKEISLTLTLKSKSGIKFKSFLQILWSFSLALIFISDRSFVFRDLHVLSILYLGLMRGETGPFTHARLLCHNQEGLTLDIFEGRIISSLFSSLSNS